MVSLFYGPLLSLPLNFYLREFLYTGHGTQEIHKKAASIL